MFKARLIEDPEYYGQRRMMLIYSIFIGIILFLLLFVLDLGGLWEVIMLLFALLMATALIIYKKRLFKLVGKQVIYADEKKIEVKYEEGDLLQSFPTNEIEKIILEEPFKFTHERTRDLVDEIKGDPLKNSITIYTKENDYTYHFEIPSYYMIEQLRKLSSSWKEMGIETEIISDVPS